MNFFLNFFHQGIQRFGLGLQRGAGHRNRTGAQFPASGHATPGLHHLGFHLPEARRALEPRALRADPGNQRPKVHFINYLYRFFYKLLWCVQRPKNSVNGLAVWIFDLSTRSLNMHRFRRAFTYFNPDEIFKKDFRGTKGKFNWINFLTRESFVNRARVLKSYNFSCSPHDAKFFNCHVIGLIRPIIIFFSPSVTLAGVWKSWKSLALFRRVNCPLKLGHDWSFI